MADTIGTYYFQLAPSTEGIGNSISEALGEEGAKSSKSFGKSFASGLATVGKVAAGAVLAAGAGVATLTKEAVSGYAEFEQLVGGVETLFGAQGMGLEEYAKSIGKTASEAAEQYTDLLVAQNAVLKNADEAYRSAGLSANDYMETVTSFAASLKQSTKTELEAATVADMAIIDMADNANKMGTSMESIQNAYQGFAKQNYTMLDNLKLGYGGTKNEMARLLADATAISGIEYDMESLSDVYNAIHVIQTELGITGTTAKEASSTISGSLSTLSASWQNLIVGLTDPDADLNSLIDNLITSTETALDNLLPAIEHALGGISKLISNIAPKIVSLLPGLISEVLPGLIEAAIELMNGLAAALPDIIKILTENLPTVVTALLNMVDTLTDTLFGMLPDFISTISQITNMVFTKLGEMLPELIPTIVSGIILVVETLIENLPLVLDGVITLVKGAAQGIIDALPILIEALPEIIGGIVDFIISSTNEITIATIQVVLALVEALPTIIMAIVDALPDIIEQIILAIIDNLPMFIEAGMQLVMGICEAMPIIIVELIELMPQIVTSIVKALVENYPKFVEAGKKLIASLCEGTLKFGDRIKETWDKIWTTIKGIFDKWIENTKEIGINIMNGLTDGIKSKITAVTDTVSSVANNISDGFKKFFGIQSPSKLFAEYGQFIDEGFAKGITNGQSVVTSAMDDLNNSVVGDIQTTASIAYDSDYSTRRVAGNSDSKLYDLLATYLPEIVKGTNSNITIEADSKGIFRLIVKESDEFKKQTGRSAFA